MKIILCFTVVVDLDGIDVNDTKEDHIIVGEEGVRIAIKISSRIRAAAENGSLSLTINGTEFVTDKYSFNILEPKQFCRKGQTFKEGYCRKYAFFRICYLFDRGFVLKNHIRIIRHCTKTFQADKLRLLQYHCYTTNL